MKLTKISSVVDSVFTVALVTADWSEADKQLMQRFGEPIINVGGAFSGGTSPTVEFTLPDSSRRIMTESPFTARFDSRDDAAAETMATIWRDEVRDRIVDAVTTLRAAEDTFTGEDSETI